MAFFLRRNQMPSLAEITAVPQIVIVDQTGPAVTLGTSPGSACMIGEFVSGPFDPTEVGSGGEAQALYGPKVYPYFSQSAADIQDGSQGGSGKYNGNGNLMLLGRTFRRLAIVRVDHEAVTTDQGTTKGALTVTVTVAAADQDVSSKTNKVIVVKAGTRFANNAAFGSATAVYAASGDTVVPIGTLVTSNALTLTIPCFPIRVVEPVVATAIAAIVNVLDPAIDNVAATTTISAVNNATTLWPQGTGTTLAARLEAQYVAAIGKTQPGSDVTSAIVVLWAARRTQAIRQALAANAVACSEMGRGRIVIVGADPATANTAAAAATAKAAAIGLAAADGYAQPADRVIVTFPKAKIKSVDLGNIAVSIDATSWMAGLLSNLSEEINPGVANEYMTDIVQVEDAFVTSPLAKQDYANLIAAGVCVLYNDRATGWQWMQGVTAANSAVYPTRTPIKRRRMADLIQDTLAEVAAPYQKLPGTTERVDAFVAAAEAFLEGLKSPNVPAAQRIVDYYLDPSSGNTDQLTALGIFVIITYVRLLPSMDYIVFNTQIGETVIIPSATAAAVG